MAALEQLLIPIEHETAEHMRAAVAGGDYRDMNDIVEQALEEWRAKRAFEEWPVETLRQVVQEGVDSGAALDAAAVFTDLRARAGKAPPR